MTLIKSETDNAEWLRIEQQRASLQAKWRKKAAFVLNRQLGRVLATMKQGGYVVEAALDSLIKYQDFEDYYKELYTEVGLKFAQRFKKKDLFDDIIAQRIVAYVLANSATKITDITETTLTEYRNIISDAILKGLGISEAMSLLTDHFKHLNAIRAERIARTEIVAASNAGSFFGAQESGIPMRKAWLSSSDNRVRGLKPKDPSSHVALNGQTVAMNEAFVEPRTGQKMMFPGDTSKKAGAENTINCRCTIIYKRDDI